MFATTIRKFINQPLVNNEYGHFNDFIDKIPIIKFSLHYAFQGFRCSLVPVLFCVPLIISYHVIKIFQPSWSCN